jgi:hypothetical protein
VVNFHMLDRKLERVRLDPQTIRVQPLHSRLGGRGRVPRLWGQRLIQGLLPFSLKQFGQAAVEAGLSLSSCQGSRRNVLDLPVIFSRAKGRQND